MQCRRATSSSRSTQGKAPIVSGLSFFYSMGKRVYHSKWRDLIRSLILCRDGFKCAICGFKSLSNHVHHIDNNPQHNEPENLITLCPLHHLQTTNSKFSFCQIARANFSELQLFFNGQVRAVNSQFKVDELRKNLP